MSALGKGIIFTHFTDAQGITGITGVQAGALIVGQPMSVQKLTFDYGNNSYLAEKLGDLFVTDLGINANARELDSIGVFGDKQNFVIQFSQETAFKQVPSVRPILVRPHIYTFPGGTTLQGSLLIQRVR